MSRLHQMYLGYIETDEYVAGQTDGVEEANKVLGVQLGKISDRTLFAELDAAIARCNSEMEEQGFIFGFRYAVQLMTECGFKECV